MRRMWPDLWVEVRFGERGEQCKVHARTEKEKYKNGKKGDKVDKGVGDTSCPPTVP